MSTTIDEASRDDARRFLQLRMLAKHGRALQTSGASAEDIYDRIVDASFSQRIFTLFRELGVSFEYHDPDTTYEADVEALLTALDARIERIAPLFNLKGLQMASDDFSQLQSDGWVVFLPTGKITWRGTADTRDEAIRTFCDPHLPSEIWPALEADGYQCRRVRLVIVE